MIIEKLTTENRFSFYSPFIRLFICFYLIKDIIVMWNFNDLLYRGNSFVVTEPAPFLEFFNINTSLIRDNFSVFYVFYILLIILFIFGIGKRITVFFLFICTEIIQNLAWLTLNGGDNILKFALLYFIFIDSYSEFSLKGFKHKNEFSKQFSNFLSNLGGYSLCIHFCLVYFISAIHKIHTDVWFNGIATYYILGSERFQGTQWNMSLIKNGFFVTLTTYGTLFIELFFPFLVWNRRLKFIMILMAVSLHLGIGFFMMLYDFQVLFIILLGFFITNEEWKSIIDNLNKFYFLMKSKMPFLKNK